MAPRFSDAQIADALRTTEGNVSLAAKLLAEYSHEIVSRSYVKNRIDAAPLLQELLEEIVEAVKDKAEENIFISVMSGNREDSKWILRTLGRDRGYVTKVETESATEKGLLEAMQEGRARVAASGMPSIAALPPPDIGETLE